MPLNRHPLLLPVLLLLVLLIALPTQSQTREYRAYKVVKKRKTLILPFRSATLSPPVCKMLDENLIAEAVKPGVFDIINRYPEFELESALAMPLNDIDEYRLAEVSDLEFLIRPSIEKTGANFVVRAVVHDVRRISDAFKYQRECPCPFEDVVFNIMPELADKMSRMKFELDSLCPPGMSAMPKTAYTMGSSSKYDNNPEIQVRVSDFCIDQYEYPNLLGTPPLTERTWAEADSACRSGGKRLCTEFEWEYACRGRFNWTWPYGNQYLDEQCNTESKEARPAGSFLSCKSEAGVFDLSGNVNEWTGSNWDANIRNKVIRGGAFFSGKKDSRCTLRFSNRPQTRAKAIGFRCCKSIR